MWCVWQGNTPIERHTTTSSARLDVDRGRITSWQRGGRGRDGTGRGSWPLRAGGGEVEDPRSSSRSKNNPAGFIFTFELAIYICALLRTCLEYLMTAETPQRLTTTASMARREEEKRNPKKDRRKRAGQRKKMNYK